MNADDQGSLEPFVPPSPVMERYGFRFHGDGLSFFLLLLKNLILTLITLGLYTPWARTERRRYIWSNLEIHGQRLQYVGTGKELFFGYVRVLGVYAIALFIGFVADKLPRILQVIINLSLTAVFLIVIPYAIYWSRAYVLSRTRWRGIRLGLVGSSKPYAHTFITTYLLSLLTLGFYTPFMIHRLRVIITGNSRLGSAPFAYDGKAGEFWWLCIKGFFLTVLTLGIYYPWFQVKLQRYRLAHTLIGQARGNFTLPGLTMLWLFLLNIVGTTLTLGVAFPWIAVYSLRTICSHVYFQGVIDFSRILQSEAMGPAAGDGLADALGVDLGF
jgi:uncharacterized membrane protein YjgN (DUF898 family)